MNAQAQAQAQARAQRQRLDDIVSLSPLLPGIATASELMSGYQ